MRRSDKFISFFSSFLFKPLAKFAECCYNIKCDFAGRQICLAQGRAPEIRLLVEKNYPTNILCFMLFVV